MIFSRALLAALFSALAFAQGPPNPFNIENGAIEATAGQPLQLSWQPTTPGTVSLILRSGASSDLAAGTPIVSNLQNSGSYTWNVPSSITRGSDYTIEIVSDSDPSATNYTPYFVLESTNTVATTTSVLSLGAPSSSLSLSTASPTASPSSTAISTASSSASTSSSSSSSVTSTGSSTTSSASSSRTSSMTTSTSTNTSALSASNAAVSTGTSPSSGGAPRATAMVGMLGAVALGALAL